MPEYTVTADYHDVHTLNDDGTRILKTARYRRGDTLTMDADLAERLVKTGGLRDVSEVDPEEPEGPQESVAPEGESPEAKADADADDESDLDSMSYPDLQAAAKDRGLPTNQSGDSLRAAIREHDAAA